MIFNRFDCASERVINFNMPIYVNVLFVQWTAPFSRKTADFVEIASFYKK